MSEIELACQIKWAGERRELPLMNKLEVYPKNLFDPPSYPKKVYDPYYYTVYLCDFCLI